MATDTKSVKIPMKVNLRSVAQRVMASSVRHFIQHYLEMCIAMCAGMVLNPGFIWLIGQIGYTEPRREIAALTALVFALDMTIPMMAWMRFRGMAWRDIREMSIASLIGAMLPIGIAWLGIIPMTAAFAYQCHLACVAMLVPMFLRLDVYTGKSCHMQHASM